MTSLSTSQIAPHSARRGVRFRPVVHLMAGDMLGMEADEAIEFEERVRFGPAAARRETPDPAQWLAARLGRVASAAHAEGAFGRPILVAAPMAALADPNTALACDAAIRRTTLCQQEFCLMFPDAAFAGEEVDCTGRVAKLRKHGFRVGVDMRRSWQTPLNETLRILIDTLRVDAEEIPMSDELQEAAIAAHASGILVVADNASWRDGSYLEESGIHGAIAPRSDA